TRGHLRNEILSLIRVGHRLGPLRAGARRGVQMADLGVVPVSDLHWPVLGDELGRLGYGVTPRLLDDEQCRELSALFDVDEAFRSTIVMSRHAFGEGTYRYFADPLPAV